MSMVGEREKTLSFECATELKQARAVTIDHANGTVAYTAAGVIPNAVTRCNAEVRQIAPGVRTVEVLQLNTWDGAKFVELEGTVVKGDQLEVGTDGKFIKQDQGTASGLRANGTGTANAIIGAYKE